MPQTSEIPPTTVRDSTHVIDAGSSKPGRPLILRAIEGDEADEPISFDGVDGRLRSKRRLRVVAAGQTRESRLVEAIVGRALLIADVFGIAIAGALTSLLLNGDQVPGVKTAVVALVVGILGWRGGG